MVRLVALLITDVSEERIACIIRVTKIGDLADSCYPDDGGDTLL
jgi:hypothetical protein